MQMTVSGSFLTIESRSYRLTIHESMAEEILQAMQLRLADGPRWSFHRTFFIESREYAGMVVLSREETARAVMFINQALEGQWFVYEQ